MSTVTAPAAPPAASAPHRRAPLWLAIVATALPMFMATLDNLVMTNALPVIQREFDATLEQLQWFMNAYTLAFASFILFAVALGDRFGRRHVFVAGVVVFTLASAAAALSSEPWQLVIARAVQGFGGAAIMPLSLTLLVGSVGPERRSMAIGIWGGIAGLGVALGPLIGGAVLEGWNWEAIFWINVPVGVVGTVLAIVAIPNSFGARLRADVLGVLLAGIGVLAVVFGIVRGNDDGWDSLTVLGSLVGGAALLGAFILWESRTSAPLLPLGLFRDRSFTIANVVGLAFSFGAFGSIFILIQFMQVVQGTTALEAGIRTMPWTLAPLVIAPLTGFLVPRFGTRALIVAGLTLQAGGMVWLALVMSADSTFLDMLVPFIMEGVGMSLVFAPSSTAVLANMSAENTAKASGTNSTMREIGTALGIAVLTAVFTGAGGELTPTGYVDAAVPAVLTGAGALALAAIVALLLPLGRPAPSVG
ncbi:DHA2 family efflux MFS transporter permease subunit [Galbitalea sp. SE-J8]|uniref:DHA2 family efflux MFS transporter permease subunit n=1 Tax=Galbitalea sp. SE-J8 TaxID=3054952 RepID=UPI00259CCEB8|nr:DHA2 family efflux MFS transporter permease subunit [Galbitalea sp. SE-J8]MDM4762633.1 DHA2 family efflux MFS transporter permease subunit [Galbitalea sp. SE-J8]